MWGWLRRLEPQAPLALALAVLRGHVQIDRLMIASHHFMDAGELASAEGRERVRQCAFLVALDGELKSMCEVNAGGLRDRFYARIAAGGHDLDSAA